MQRGSVMLKSNLFKNLPIFCLLFVWVYTGCSYKYMERDFDSRSDYYSKINSVFEDRSAEVKFMNGEKSSGNDIHISGDSVYLLGMVTEPFASVPLKYIKKINYNSYLSYNPVKFNGSIQLKNDSVIYVNDAVILENKINTFRKYEKLFSQPVKDISSISYKNHLKGMRDYGFAGMFAGGVFGYKGGSDASIRNRSPELGLAAGSIFFGLCGAITGAIFGNSENYILNDNESAELRFLKRFGVIAGITSSALYGGFSDYRQYKTTYKEQYTFGIFYLWDINNALKIRPEINYSIKGGIYTYMNLNVKYTQQATTNVYIDIIEAPILIQLTPFPHRISFLKILAGPSVSIPIKGKLEEYYNGPMDELFKFSDGKVNAESYFSFIYGIGVKWDSHFSTELLFDKELSGFGTAQMPDGTKLNLQQSNFLISTTFSL